MLQSLFDRCIDANQLVAGIEKEEELITASKRVTPKMFAHSIKTKCLANPQHIVLPEVRSTAVRAGRQALRMLAVHVSKNLLI